MYDVRSFFLIPLESAVNSSARRPHASQVQKGLSPHPRVRNVIAERLPDMPLLADLSVLIERLDSWVQET